MTEQQDFTSSIFPPDETSINSPQRKRLIPKGPAETSSSGSIDYDNYTHSGSPSQTFQQIANLFQPQVDYQHINQILTPSASCRNLLRVVNAPFMYGSLLLPQLFWSAGIIVTSICFMFMFFMVTIQTRLMNELRMHTQKLKAQDIARALGLGRIVCRFISATEVVNNFLYCVVLLTSFGYCVSGSVQIYNTSTNRWNDARAITGYGGLLITIFTYKLFYPVMVAQTSRFLAILGLTTVVLGNVIYQGVQNTYDNELFIFPATSEKAFESLRLVPCLMLLFSHMHQLTEEEYLRQKYEQGPNNTLEHTMPGFLLSLTFYYLIGILSTIVFTSDLDHENVNLISLILYDQLNTPQTNKTVGTITLILIGIPAIVQILQYSFLSVHTVYQWTVRHTDEPVIHRTRLYLIVTIFQALVVGVSVGVSRIDGVIILMGATTSNFITMVIPALLYLRSDNRTFYRRAGAITLIGFGIVFMFTTLLAEVFAAYDQI